MCDLHFKFEEDRTKTAVAIESDRYFGRTDGQTDRQTNTQVILYVSNAMNCIGQTTILAKSEGVMGSEDGDNETNVIACSNYKAKRSSDERFVRVSLSIVSR